VASPIKEIFDDWTGTENTRLAPDGLERGRVGKDPSLAQAESTEFRTGLDDEGRARVSRKLRGYRKRNVLRERRIAGRDPGDTGSAGVFSRRVEPGRETVLGGALIRVKGDSHLWLPPFFYFAHSISAVY